MAFRPSSEVNCRAKAQAWMKRGFVLIDTETTGFDPSAEIVQFCAIAHTGRVLLHSLVRPKVPIDIEGGAYKVHGLDDSALEHAPPFRRLWPAIHSVMANRLCIAYNSQFDSRIINQLAVGDPQCAKNPVFGHQWECAMLLCADYLGVKKWPKLQAACDELQISLTNAHDALYDCYAALAIIKHIAGPEDQWERTAVDEAIEIFGGEVVSTRPLRPEAPTAYEAPEDGVDEEPLHGHNR